MSALIEGVDLRCPYCGEITGVEVDCTAGDQCYYEDCQVCCAPVRIRVAVDERGCLRHIEGLRDDE